MFYNCDLSLLRYGFYRNAAYEHFRIRFGKVLGLNLSIAAALGVSLLGEYGRVVCMRSQHCFAGAGLLAYSDYSCFDIGLRGSRVSVGAQVWAAHVSREVIQMGSPKKDMSIF